MKLHHQIYQINNALGQLGQSKAYNIQHPRYNYRGFNFRRIAECATALNLSEPEDVPCWDYWVDTYRVTELFWKLWEYDQNEQGDPSRVLKDQLDRYLNGCLLATDYKTKPVLGQVAALTRVRQPKEVFDRLWPISEPEEA